MRITTEGYSAGFNQESLRIRASKVGRLLRNAFVELGTNVVVVSGNSGVSMGYAVLAMCRGLDMQLVLVRKANDGSHGTMVEGPRGLEIKRYIFLDDLIDSGATVRRVNTALLHRHETQRGWYPHEYIVGPDHNCAPRWLLRLCTIRRVTTGISSILTHPVTIRFLWCIRSNAQPAQRAG